MNILKIPYEDLTFIELSNITNEYIVDEFRIDYTKLIYVTQNGVIVGIIDRDFSKDYKENLKKSYVVYFTAIPKTKEIENIFKNNHRIKRISVWISGKLYCEYRDLDEPYLSKSLSYSIKSLTYIPFIEKEINDFFSKNKVLCVADETIAKYLKKHISNIEIKNDIFNIKEESFDYIYDLKYGKHIRRCLFNFGKIDDFYNLVTKIYYSLLIKYLESKKIRYIFLHDDQYEHISKLSNLEEEVLENKRDFYELINDEKYLNEFSKNDDDKEFLKNFEFAQSQPWYSNFSIIQSDIKSKHLNIHKGIRYSGSFPKQYSGEIHFYGPCSVFGLCGIDSYTFEYQLQSKFNDNQIKKRVFNHGVLLGNNLLNSIVQVLETPLIENDIVVIYYIENFTFINNKNLIETSFIYNKYKTKEQTLFLDRPGHCNREANRILAEYFYKKFFSCKKAIKKERSSWNMLKFFDCNDNLECINPNIYNHQLRLKKIKEIIKDCKKIGVIFMYATPFTKGHLELIKVSLKEVDKLVVFVVSEFFHDLYICDRFNIVKENLESFKNVIVLCTESYFASKQYFEEYSNRESKQVNKKLIVKQEIISSKYVCQYLGITDRFLGEEKEDKVTNVYNNLVMEIYSKQNINVHILQRFNNKKGIISAKKVREIIKKNELKELDEYLTKKTIIYMKYNELI